MPKKPAEPALAPTSSRLSLAHDASGSPTGSHAIQDYLKAIFKLQHGSGTRTTATMAIAEKLGISAASVTGMLKKLDQGGLVIYHPYQGVQLTETGRGLALEMIRHHRLIELYLTKALGYTWDKVDAEAERLEHVISEELEDAMAAFLNQPAFDPHGDPIPTREGYMPDTLYDPLTSMVPGQRVRIRRVKDSDPGLLRYLGELGMYPDVVVEVIEKGPFDGPLVIRVGPAAREPGSHHALGAQVTDSVFVEPLDPEAV